MDVITELVVVPDALHAAFSGRANAENLHNNREVAPDTRGIRADDGIVLPYML